MNLRLGPTTGVHLAGSGVAFPSEIGLGDALTNEEAYHRLLGADAEEALAARGWKLDHPFESWGVKRREWMRRDGANAGAGTIDVVELAASAVERALADAGLAPSDTNILLAATSSPGRITSTLAASVGKRLAVTAPCLDVRAGGAGGLSAWVTATRFVSDECRVAVVVAVETPSLYLDEGDLAMAMLYGDGAAAIVLRHEPEADGGLLGAVLGRADATGRPFTVPGALPPSVEQIEEGKYRYQRPDAAYLESLSTAWAALCADLSASFAAVAADVEYFLPYAVTAGQVHDAATALGLPRAQVVHTLADHGCIGCPSPLVGLDLLRRERRVDTGQVLALAAVAGGVSTAGMLWRL